MSPFRLPHTITSHSVRSLRGAAFLALTRPCLGRYSSVSIDLVPVLPAYAADSRCAPCPQRLPERLHRCFSGLAFATPSDLGLAPILSERKGVNAYLPADVRSARCYRCSSRLLAAPEMPSCARVRSSCHAVCERARKIKGAPKSSGALYLLSSAGRLCKPRRLLENYARASSAPARAPASLFGGRTTNGMIELASMIAAIMRKAPA